MNRRQTYGGGGIFNKRGNNSKLPRHSLAAGGALQNNHNIGNRGQGGMRRSSIMMNPIKMAKDPRPLKNKEWVMTQIECVIHYLCQHGYDASMLSPKELNPPSTKNFQRICCFLFQQIDPTFDVMGTSFEEECISFFEKLGYPFKINKSSMRCIAPHSWPPLLGALSWLIELLSFAESFDGNKDGGDDPEGAEMGEADEEDISGEAKSQKADREFFNLVAENYGHWLKGTDDDQVITQRVMAVYIQKTEGLQQNIESFQKANKQLITEKERIESVSPSIASLQDTRQQMIEGIDEMKKVKQQRLEYLATLKEKLGAIDQKVNEKIVRIEQAEATIAELNEALSRQTISAKDVENMNRESAALNAQTDELLLQKQEIQRKQYDVTEAINGATKKLQHLVLEYNDLAQKIEIIPVSAKYSFGQNHTLRLIDDLDARRSVTKATDLCNQDLEYFGNNLQKLTGHYNDKLTKSAVVIKSEQDRISQIRCDLEIEQNEVGILNERLSNVVGRYNEEKKKMSDLTSKTAASIEQIELDMTRQSGDIEDRLKNKNKELAAAKHQLRALQEQCRKIEIELTSKIGISIQKLLKHRGAVRSQLKAVHKKLDDALQKMAFYHIQEPTVHRIGFDPDGTADVEMAND